VHGGCCGWDCPRSFAQTDAHEEATVYFNIDRSSPSRTLSSAATEQRSKQPCQQVADAIDAKLKGEG
jgi:hypothetical protein